MEAVRQGGLLWDRNEDWDDIRHGIFSRHGGVSEAPWNSLNLGASIGDDAAAVRENHRRMYQAAAVNAAGAYSCWLVHSVDTLVLGPRSNGQLQKADAIITNLPDRPLVMRYADCVPLLLYDRSKRAIGLGHAGWRGTVQGMAANMVRMLRATYACRPEDIAALLGPAISARNYEVGEEVVTQAEAYFGAAAGLIWREPSTGRPHFDLWQANRLDFARCGVKNVKILDICTYENTEDFYSHRAEKGRTGRFGVVISL